MTYGKYIMAVVLGWSLIGVPSGRTAEIEVDVELVLAVDVSRSMSPRELEIQRRGYAEALISEEVVRAIERGLIGQIALRYVEWAGHGSQRVIVNWTLISNRQQARQFANRIAANFDSSLRRTSISSAIDQARLSFYNNGFSSNRQVIDISGDGPNNSGLPVLDARQTALQQGIVINGLPLMTKDGFYNRYNLDDLDDYYRHCVVGGPASFVVPVLTWEQFPIAVRSKLVQELASHGDYHAKMVSYQKPADAGYDCLIGEKMWQQRRLDWGDDL